MLLGSIVGAGIASGREVAFYFSRFGVYSYLAIFLTVIILAFLMLFFFKLSNNSKGFSSFIDGTFYKGKKFIKGLFLISLIIFSSAMLSGTFEIGKMLNIGGGVVALVTVILCVVSIKNIHVLSSVNFILFPFLIVFICIVCCTNNSILLTSNNMILSITSSIIYPFINIVSLGMFIIEIGYRYTKKEKIWAVIISSFIVFLLMIFINNSILSNGVVEDVMPLVSIAKLKGNCVYTLMIIFVWIGLFTTLASNIFVLKNSISLNVSESFKSVILLLMCLSLCCFGFEIFVNYVYCFIGVVGFVFVLGVLKKELKH
ncbi:MAG: hypothetical protein E7345_02360 [Clostridiales bacterium]|nr:hypothetical protein [Clostridiales bacterium]